MKVNVLFFGVLAEVSGLASKTYDGVSTAGGLKMRVFDDFPEMTHYTFRIAVNNEISPDDKVLSDGDEVAFLPPFAGG